MVSPALTPSLTHDLTHARTLTYAHTHTLTHPTLVQTDVVFLIFLYQRWVYRVDPKRRNEYGTAAEQDDGQEQQQEGKERGDEGEENEKGNENKKGEEVHGKVQGKGQRRADDGSVTPSESSEKGKHDPSLMADTAEGAGSGGKHVDNSDGMLGLRQRKKAARAAEA